MRSIGWLLCLAACGPIGEDPNDYNLVGVWAVEDVTAKKSGVATKTKIEFFRDGDWVLKRDQQLCGTPLEGWFCEEEGTWKLRPDAVTSGEEVTLVIDPAGKKTEVEKFEAVFHDPSTFCWKRNVLGEECLLRAD